jgi:hypothetical protein
MDEYTNLSYEETKKVIKEYFSKSKNSMIKFRLSLKDTDLDSPMNKNNGLEDKFFGS